MVRVVILLLYNTILTVLAIEDSKKRKIRNRYPAAILLLSLISLFLVEDIALLDRFGGMLVISVPILLLSVLVPGCFGGGDVKLCFACGAFLGGYLVLKGTIYAILLAGVYCLWLVYKNKTIENVQFAFGPFLAIGYGIVSLQI